MAPGLNISISKDASLQQLMEETRYALSQLLRCELVPPFEIELPPAKRGLSLEGAWLRRAFPGGYVTLTGIQGSMVDILVFKSLSRELLGCSSAGRTAASDVMTAAIAIAAARSLEGRIEDSEHYWMDRDEYGAEDLISALALSEEQTGMNFETAIALVSKKQFKVPTYGSPEADTQINP